jgi:hypothetical protein
MHPVLQYILACLVAGAIGVSSAAVVFALWWLLRRHAGIRLEMTFAFSRSIGFAVMWAGIAIDSRVLSAASIVLWGWMVLPILVTPPLLLSRVVTWCRLRIAS